MPVGGGNRVLGMYQMVQPSPGVLKVSEQLGFVSMPLINRWRFFDTESDSFDPVRYAEKIWTPDLDHYPDLGTWSKFGIPPHYLVWVDLDFEKWDPIFNPDDYPNQVVVSRVQDYLDLIQSTRELRPSARVCIHGLIRGPLEGLSGSLIEMIVSQCDAISPSMASNFDRDFSGLQQQMNIKRARILACLEFKAQHGTKVFPVVNKRYQLIGPDGTIALDEEGRQIRLLVPQEILEQMMEVVFTTEFEGLKVDGVIVWSADNRILHADPDLVGLVILPDTPDQQTADSSEVQFMEIVAESAQEFWYGGGG